MNGENITIQKIYEESFAIGNGKGLIAPLGIKENGEIEYVDYAKINHLIVCGTSGSGKTTFVRALLTSLMSASAPDALHFCIYDSKRIDYTDFNALPFLLMPVVTDSKKGCGVINFVYYEAKKRQNILADNGNIDDFPDIFVVLDDYAEIDQDRPSQEALYELLQIAHRVKIHVIIVTSIALAKILSTELKVNIPNRISFFLPERRNSQVVIDQDGAEALEFPGEFIAKFYGKIKTLHAIELSNCEIKNFCDFIKSGEKCGEPIFEKIVGDWHLESIEADESMKRSPEDEISKEKRNASCAKSLFFEEAGNSNDTLYENAVKIVTEAGLASTSLLQRRLSIGYRRAESLIDQMEANGLLDPKEGTKPRKVKIVSAK